MKREIKFRAWDSITEAMGKVTALEGNTTRIELADEVRKRPYQVDRANAEVMQFTGLKDKNGKDIYEADVVTLHGDTWVCVYDAPQYWLSKDGTTDALEDTFYSSSGFLYEVIGNIYETPHLVPPTVDKPNSAF